MDSDALPHLRAELIALMTELFLIGAGFAIYLILSLFCLRFVLFDISDSPKSRNFLLSFIFILTAVVSIDFLVAYTAFSSLFLCALNSDTPLVQCGDPSLDKTAARRVVATIVAEGILYILADGMLYYRAIVIWQRNIWCVIIAGLLFVASEACQILTQIVSFDDAGFIIQAASFWFASFYDISVSSSIIWKLISYRRNARVSERQESVSLYTSLAVIFFEASLFYSLSRILLASLLVTNQQYLWGYWPGLLVDLAAATSPLFIILRLALNSFKDPYRMAKPATHQADAESSMVFARPAVAGDTQRSILLETTRTENTKLTSAGGFRTLSMPTETPETTTLPTMTALNETRMEKGKPEEMADGVASRGSGLQIEKLN